MKLRDISAGGRVTHDFSTFENLENIYDGVFLADQVRLVTAHGDGSIRVWNSEGGNQILRLRGHIDRINAIAVDDGPNHDAGDDNGRRGAEHIGRNGVKVEINGNNVEVVHASGIKEEVENGRYELKDAAGRTIVERRATARDVARLTNTAR